MSQLPQARDVTLRKLKPLAPNFHRHIARSKLLGRSCQVGDRVVVYEITGTDPEGQVQVSPNTVLHFE